MSETFVRVVLQRRLLPLAGLADQQGANHNVFLEAISPTLAVSSKLTRSLTSRLGGSLAGVARDLAIGRYGEDAVPPVVISPTVQQTPRAWAGSGGDTVIFTQLPEAATKAAATRLLRAAGSDQARRIGSPGFREAFRDQLRELLAADRAPTPWSVRVDLYVADPLIGLAELESGGELDTSNVKGQPEKLVLAGLCLADPDVPLHFCLAYANQGEGRPIKGGLPGYLAYAGADTPSSGLLVGSGWWVRVLPVDVSFARFIELFAEVCRELGLVPA